MLIFCDTQNTLITRVKETQQRSTSAYLNNNNNITQKAKLCEKRKHNTSVCVLTIWRTIRIVHKMKGVNMENMCHKKKNLLLAPVLRAKAIFEAASSRYLCLRC